MKTIILEKCTMSEKMFRRLMTKGKREFAVDELIIRDSTILPNGWTHEQAKEMWQNSAPVVRYDFDDPEKKETIKIKINSDKRGDWHPVGLTDLEDE